MEQVADPLWGSLLTSWLPFLLFFAFLWFFLRRYSLSPKSKYGQLIDRSFEHYDRVEEKLDRIAELLEQKS